MNYLRIIITSVLFLISHEASADDSIPKRKRGVPGFKPLSDTVNSEKSGFFILPLIYFTPDTRWAFGGAGVYYFKLPSKDSIGKDTRVSNVQFLGDYTQNKQLDLWGQWNVFTRNENFLFKGELRFRNFPDRFYGIGNATSKDFNELYEYNLFSFKSLFLKKIHHGLFLGFDYHFEETFGFVHQPNSSLLVNNITGNKGTRQSALGLVTVYDTRDNVINSHKGQLVEISSYFYNKAIGSTYNFNVLNFTYHQFFKIKRNHILALQTKARFASGEVPFLDLSIVGNDDLLRGYPKNRYRDHNFVGTQVEYRFPLFWRFGMTTFVGVGDVFKKQSDLKFENLKYSVGAGLRFVINPAERLNLRLDYGYGKEGGYFYILVAEAF
ncbi:MAG: BamA/TamA family outer membrane protein [Bacteroidetes bacterium]|jgi:hypothetical protein|nr:BamA/TamA family outer membrane protein [Bacteroidota bacterium]MCA6442478.1 BamA/TamA family outer membrane protein [Bacteroidota bacterium]